MYFFYLKLIILHHGDKNSLFWHVNQIHTFNNNLNEEGLITSHLMCANFFMINLDAIMLLCYNFSTITEKPGKTCYKIKPFRHCEI